MPRACRLWLCMTRRGSPTPHVTGRTADMKLWLAASNFQTAMVPSCPPLKRNSPADASDNTWPCSHQHHGQSYDAARLLAQLGPPEWKPVQEHSAHIGSASSGYALHLVAWEALFSPCDRVPDLHNPGFALQRRACPCRHDFEPKKPAGLPLRVVIVVV